MTAQDREARQRVVKRLTLAGWTAREIAEREGCSVRQVKRDRSALGIARPRAPQVTAGQLEFARQLLEDGASRTEVARTIGVDEKTMRRWFPEHKWSPEQIAEHVQALRLEKGGRR